MKYKITIILLAGFLITTLSNSKTLNSSYDILRYDQHIKAGIQLSIEQSYTEAIMIFNEIKRTSPENPIGYFFHAAVLQTKMMDCETYDQEKIFFALMDSTISYAKNQITRNKNDAWAYFYLGSAYGYRSFYLSKQKKYVEAFHNARLSIRGLEMAVKIDSTLYDAYLGLGTYKYYQSHFSKYISWMPFIEDERETGITMVKIAMDKSRYSYYSALNTICWMLIEEKKYKEGLSLIKPVLQDFPESRIFLWCAAKLSKKLENWPEAMSYYTQILQSFKKENIYSPFNELTCRKNLSEIYFHLKEYDKAKQECEKAAQIKFESMPKRQNAQTLKALEKNCSTYHFR